MIPCTICGGPLDDKGIVVRSLFTKQMIIRYKCTQCGAIIGPLDMVSMPFYKLRDVYRDSYLHHGEADSTNLELEAFHALHPDKNKSYLNYGAGTWSHSIEQLRAEGYNVIGYEPFADLAANVVSNLLPATLGAAPMKFDGIYSSEVIEHFQQPVEEFAHMKSLLRPGGRMAHRSSGFEWLIPQSEFHLVFYLGRSVEALCKRAGLKVTHSDKWTRVFEVNV